MKHSRISPCGFHVAGGTLCASEQRRQAARHQRGYGTDWQALRLHNRIRPVRAALGRGREASNLTTLWLAKPVVPMMRPICFGFAIRAIRGRRRRKMAALGTPGRPNTFVKGAQTTWVHSSVFFRIGDFNSIELANVRFSAHCRLKSDIVACRLWVINGPDGLETPLPVLTEQRTSLRACRDRLTALRNNDGYGAAERAVFRKHGCRRRRIDQDTARGPG